MASRNDTYLSLCIAQAERSNLHYRHGAIVVRGGKVIGSGFNDNRSGFSGGALKTGKLANGSLDGPALKDLKMKRRKLPTGDTSDQSTRIFMPYEASGIHTSGMGGGPHANTPLTLHSEMAAIQNALAASSSKLARDAMSLEKPCWKLPSDARKRKARLYEYVERICAEAVVVSKSQKQLQSRQRQATKQRTEQSHVQASQFEPCASQSGLAREREVANEREREEEPLQQPQIDRQRQQQRTGAASLSESCLRPYEGASIVSTTTGTTLTTGGPGRCRGGSSPSSSPFWSSQFSQVPPVSVRVSV